VKEVDTLSAKKLTKKQLKEDTFITTMLRTWEYFRDNQNKFFMGLIAIVVIIAAFVWVSHSKKQTEETVLTQFSEALGAYRSGEVSTAIEIFKLISERHSSLKEGAYAAYFHGKCLLESGKNAEAVEAFDRYLENSNRHPFFRDAALSGKAVALENSRRYAEAADIYMELSAEIKTNSFMEKKYLRRAAENLKLSNRKEKAIDVMEKLLDLTSGVERRDIEVELELLRG
jgi:tetratricopeptide (TPR) repeat protein